MAFSSAAHIPAYTFKAIEMDENKSQKIEKLHKQCESIARLTSDWLSYTKKAYFYVATSDEMMKQNLVRIGITTNVRTGLTGGSESDNLFGKTKSATKPAAKSSQEQFYIFIQHIYKHFDFINLMRGRFKSCYSISARSAQLGGFGAVYMECNNDHYYIPFDPNAVVAYAKLICEQEEVAVNELKNGIEKQLDRMNAFMICDAVGATTFATIKLEPINIETFH